MPLLPVIAAVALTRLPGDFFRGERELAGNAPCHRIIGLGLALSAAEEMRDLWPNGYESILWMRDQSCAPFAGPSSITGANLHPFSAHELDSISAAVIEASNRL